MRKRAQTIFFILLNAMLFSEASHGMAFPEAAWEVRSPESQGVDSMQLSKAMRYLADNIGGTGVSEAAIIRNGYIIWKGDRIDTAHAVYSVTKSFTITVLGLLIAESKVKLDDYVARYLPRLDSDYAAYAEMTFRHLASMTSGYEGIRECWSLFRSGRMAEYDSCVSTYTTPGPPSAAPGAMFQYNDAPVHLLGYVLTRIAGRSLQGIFQEKIAGRIGIGAWDWSDYGKQAFGAKEKIIFNNPAGTPGGASPDSQGGVRISAADLARYGLLYLNRGKWKGKQLLDESWIDQAVATQVPSSLPYRNYDVTGRYGFMWRTNGIGREGKRPWPSAPPKTYAAQGASRNFCFVIPEWNMVIVRMDDREDMNAGRINDIWDNFFKRLGRSLQKGAFWDSDMMHSRQPVEFGETSCRAQLARVAE